MSETKNIILAITYFALATFFTWCFIEASNVYISMRQQVLSTGIAGAKWAIHIAAAYCFLENKKWAFIKKMGFICLIGSVILMPYSILLLDDYFDNRNSTPYFTASLFVAVVVMLILYLLNVKKMGLPIKWFWGWVFCLAVAIMLQLTVVFSVIKF